MPRLEIYFMLKKAIFMENCCLQIIKNIKIAVKNLKLILQMHKANIIASVRVHHTMEHQAKPHVNLSSFMLKSSDYNDIACSYCPC